MDSRARRKQDPQSRETQVPGRMVRNQLVKNRGADVKNQQNEFSMYTYNKLWTNHAYLEQERNLAKRETETLSERDPTGNLKCFWYLDLTRTVLIKRLELVEKSVEDTRTSKNRRWIMQKEKWTLIISQAVKDLWYHQEEKSPVPWSYLQDGSGTIN